MRRRPFTILLALAVVASSAWACNTLPGLPALPSGTPRSGTQVGIAADFLANFAELEKAGKLAALTPILTHMLSDGTGNALLDALQVISDNGKAAPYASALAALLNSASTAPLAALLARNGPAHQALSASGAAQAASVAARLDATGVLRAAGYQALGSLLSSPLAAQLLPAAAEALREGGGLTATYLADAMTLNEATADGGTQPAAIAALDLALALQSEGNLHPLLDPWLQALSSQPIGELTRVGSAVLDDFQSTPADLAQWGAGLDALGAVMGTGVLGQVTTSADGVSPSPVRQFVDALWLGNTPTVFGSTATVVPVNDFALLNQILGPGGSSGIAALQALRAQDPSITLQLIQTQHDPFNYPYHFGQPVTTGSAGQLVGFVVHLQMVRDALGAYSDTSSLINLVGNIPGAYDLLSSQMQCGPIAPDGPFSIPNFNQNVALQSFDDINSWPDALTATERATFLACFYARYARIGTFLQNPLVSGSLSLFGVDVDQILNPTALKVTSDQEGLALLGSLYDPDFNLQLTDESALGPHVREGMYRVLYPFSHALEAEPTGDPILSNGLEALVTLLCVNTQQSYVGPDGATHAVAGDDLLTPLLPLIEPLIGTPTPQASPGNQLFTLFWTLQALPIDGSTVGEVMLQGAAAAVARHTLPDPAPLLGPVVDALEKHRDDLDRLGRALWPNGGAFALDGSAGTPLRAVDVLVSGAATRTGLSNIFGGASPSAAAPVQLQALAGAPLDQSLSVARELRQVDPSSQIYALSQRLLAQGIGTPFSQAGANALDVPGSLSLANLTLSSGLLPELMDLLALVDQLQLTPSLIGIADTFVQAEAAVEALDLLDLTLQDSGG